MKPKKTGLIIQLKKVFKTIFDLQMKEMIRRLQLSILHKEI